MAKELTTNGPNGLPGTCRQIQLLTSNRGPLATPVNAAFTQGAGSLVDGTYYYRVSAINDCGETLASAETSLVVTGGPGGVNVNWGAVAGATGYRIYGRATGAELFLKEVGAVTTWLDDGSLTPAGSLPAANTTDTSPWFFAGDLGFEKTVQVEGMETGGTVQLQRRLDENRPTQATAGVNLGAAISANGMTDLTSRMTWVRAVRTLGGTPAAATVTLMGTVAG